MKKQISTVALASVFAVMLSTSLSSAAELSAEMKALLQTAATTNDGAHLQTVVDLAIAANPEAKDAILAAVAAMQAPAPAAEEPAPAPAPVAVAAETEAEKPGFFGGWDGSADLNALYSTGNTDQATYGLGVKMTKDQDRFHHLATFTFDANESNDVQDREKWALGYKLDYDFAEDIFVSGFAGYENDKFGPFRERFTLSSGLGYRILNDEVYSWSVQGGPSVFYTKEFSGDDFDSEFNGAASSAFKWMINDRSEFSNDTGVFFGTRSVLSSKSELKVKINGALSSKVSFDFLYDNEPAAGRNSTDTVTRLGLSYDF